MGKEFTNDEIENIKQLYIDGVSITEIAKKYYHCRTSKISKIIKEDPNITIRNYPPRKLSQKEKEEICELYKTGHYNQKILSEKFHCSSFLIRDALIEMGVQIESRKVRHSTNINLNEHYFSKIDSEYKAYFLGFLFADGCVEAKGQLSFEIHFRDKEILDKFKEELNLGSKISYRKRKNTEMVCIRCSNKFIVEDLAKYGIVPNKTKVTKHLPDIPEEFIAPFIRGLIDGDGWYSISDDKYLHVGFVSNYSSTCEDFKRYCDLITGMTSNVRVTTKGKKSSGYVMQFASQKYVKQLVTALYADCNICLTQKYKKVEFILESKNDEDIV